MEQTYIRIGNESYEKQNGSHGMTTLKDRHVKISSGSMTFCFKGKKGIQHTIKLNNKRIAKIVKQCRDIPGKNSFNILTKKGNIIRLIPEWSIHTSTKLREEIFQQKISEPGPEHYTLLKP